MSLAPPRIGLGALPEYARERLESAERFAAPRLTREAFALTGLDLELRCADPDFVALCRARLVERADTTPAPHRASVYVLDPTLAGWAPPALWDVDAGFLSREFDRALAAAGLRGYYHHDAPSWQVFDPTAGVGVHALPAPMAIPPWERGSPLRLFLHWAYAAGGARLAHAATLGLAGRGALLVGPSGSGKSGATLAGLLYGLTSAGDDYVVLSDGPEIVADAIFRVFKQDEAGLRRVGLSPQRLAAGPANWRGKYEFDAPTLAPDRFVPRLAIAAVVIPEIARLPRTRIEPVSAQTAALAVAPSAVLQLPGDADDGFRFFARLARRLPAYRARLSEDPAEIAAAIGALLADLRDAA